MENDLLFADKENRDKKYRELKQSGVGAKRYSVRGQQLHPQYIEDRKETLEGRDRGFGNAAYQMTWSVLYGVRWTPIPPHALYIERQLYR